MEPIVIYADPESNVINAAFIEEMALVRQRCSDIAWKGLMQYDA
jgi:hypothetical protein